ncbi:hypothetical protein [Euzebya sp.]|uniref:hypothetical protein n=1 Tax=Euzebya sp. TaxID=1971409 RepID=UPI0035122854
MTGVIDAHGHHVTVEGDGNGVVVVDTDQGVFVALWPKDALALAAQLALASVGPDTVVEARS